MKNKSVLFFIFLIVLSTPLGYASLGEGIKQIEDYVQEYNQGGLDVAKLIVYTEYTLNKIYEELDKEEKQAFTEGELQGIFEKKKERTPGRPEEGERRKRFEKVFTTKDFELIFFALPFYRHDQEYYEKKEAEAKTYYRISYEIKALKEKAGGEELKKGIESFIEELKSREAGEEEKFQELKKKFSKIKEQLAGKENCEEFLGEVLEEDKNETEMRGGLKEEKGFFTKVKEEQETQCHESYQCQPVCGLEEVCNSDCSKTQPVCSQQCSPECREEEACEEVCTEGNGTEKSCSPQCTKKQVCQDTCQEICHQEPYCEKVCQQEERCHDECRNKQICKNVTKGMLRIEGVCREGRGEIFVSGGGSFERYNRLNEGEKGCGTDIGSLVRLRKMLQSSLNKDFAAWFFEEFLEENPERMVNGEPGFRKVLEILIRNEEEIANSLPCLENEEWPAGFEPIEIDYQKGNRTRIEVWEKKIPVEGKEEKLWTTLYRYYWVPEKELGKKLIEYQIKEKGTFGPSAKDIAEIKADEGKMELISQLAEKYGGSFDVKLELVEKGEVAVKKYLQVNPEVAVRITDLISEEDISVTIDYEVLYNFIGYMVYTMEGQEIRGPYWLRIKEEEGLGKFFSVLGAVSRFWREGITLKPRYALLKIFFNAKDIITLISQMKESPPEGAEKESEIMEKVVVNDLGKD